MPKHTPSKEGLTVAVVGLEFGAEFVPIYRDHPDVADVRVCDLDKDLTAQVARTHGVSGTYAHLDAVLADDAVDAVHLVTGFPDHAAQSVASLQAGKHTACTVPAALSVPDLWRVIEAEDVAGRNYMMMETAVFTREFFLARRLRDAGGFGTVSLARGTHFQDMTGWPAYWRGLPPMYYMTHAVAPLLTLLGTRATSVRALGAGRLPEAYRGTYDNPFTATSALFRLAEGAGVADDAVAEVTRTLYRTARSYTESFSVYGDRGSFEWAQLEGDEEPVVFTMGEERGGGRGRPVTARRTAPGFDEESSLPEPVRRYCRRFVHGTAGHRSFVQGGGHGGSHPYLVHEFVSSVVEGRPAAVDARTAAAWTAAGLTAHASAMRDGEPLPVPDFTGPGPAAAPH